MWPILTLAQVVSTIYRKYYIETWEAMLGAGKHNEGTTNLCLLALGGTPV